MVGRGADEGQPERDVHAVIEGDHVEHHDGPGHESGHGHGLTDMGYVKVAIALAIVTALEVALSYSGLHGAAFMVPLLLMMLGKFVTVVSFFMHLRFDNRIFTWLFYSGLILAVLVYCASLATFHVFDPG